MDECASQISSFTPSSSSSSLGSCHSRGATATMASTTMLLRALASRVCLDDAGSSLSGARGRLVPSLPVPSPARLAVSFPRRSPAPRRAPASPPRAVGDDVAMRLLLRRAVRRRPRRRPAQRRRHPRHLRRGPRRRPRHLPLPVHPQRPPLTVGYTAATPPRPRLRLRRPRRDGRPTRATRGSRGGRASRRPRRKRPRVRRRSRHHPRAPRRHRGVFGRAYGQTLGDGLPSPSPSSPSSWA